MWSWEQEKGFGMCVFCFSMPQAHDGNKAVTNGAAITMLQLCDQSLVYCIVHLSKVNFFMSCADGGALVFMNKSYVAAGLSVCC